ncbi:glutathione S-transferase [Nitrosomonas sp.]|uniref:glutathione S-transferase n=1 Tax=Nitrosomonas sp. TaxID=42353 RepID=UPI00284C0437|nr:glutathione S-transferase [Nitrosomonas sp.]MDR4515371.1 glutathione S-transferase [Nitrosomonas sp.]
MKPLLFTFRRCPYAIRARMAIKVSGIDINMQEVDLRDKPATLLECSPKGTVPVVRLADGSVIDESLDIMKWALAVNDPNHWLDCPDGVSDEVDNLIARNDGLFKKALDYYKYSVRYPEHPAHYYREQAVFFLEELDVRLSQNNYLMTDRLTIADAAIFPFIRQFVHVDKDWFYASQYSHLIRWLDAWLSSEIFLGVMNK